MPILSTCCLPVALFLCSYFPATWYDEESSKAVREIEIEPKQKESDCMGSTMTYAQQRSGHYNGLGNDHIRKISLRFRRKATGNSHCSKVVCHDIVPESLVTISRPYTDVVHLSKLTREIKGFGCGLHDQRDIHTSLAATLEPRKEKLGRTIPDLIIQMYRA